MRKFVFTVVACCFVLVTGLPSAQAGGSSDTSGDGFHCYLFFEFPDNDNEFAQAMVNDSDRNEVLKKVDEFIDKYEGDEDGYLAQSIGNLGEASAVCNSMPACDPEAEGDPEGGPVE